MTLSVISLLPLLAAFVGLQALLVVTVADRADSRGLHPATGGR